ncbi:MAG: hypothetical protein SNJ79_07995 [Sphingomonadaceae bacterium]
MIVSALIILSLLWLAASIGGMLLASARTLAHVVAGHAPGAVPLAPQPLVSSAAIRLR